VLSLLSRRCFPSRCSAPPPPISFQWSSRQILPYFCPLSSRGFIMPVVNGVWKVALLLKCCSAPASMTPDAEEVLLCFIFRVAIAGLPTVFFHCRTIHHLGPEWAKAALMTLKEGGLFPKPKLTCDFLERAHFLSSLGHWLFKPLTNGWGKRMPILNRPTRTQDRKRQKNLMFKTANYIGENGQCVQKQNIVDTRRALGLQL